MYLIQDFNILKSWLSPGSRPHVILIYFYLQFAHVAKPEEIDPGKSGTVMYFDHHWIILITLVFEHRGTPTSRYEKVRSQNQSRVDRRAHV